jgi:hypothetical protein
MPDQVDAAKWHSDLNSPSFDLHVLFENRVDDPCAFRPQERLAMHAEMTHSRIDHAC